MPWNLHILGSNAALPIRGRFPSAQVLHTGRDLFLLDCGEGTQMRLLYTDVRWSRISRIFISHLHGDHIFGLPGLITTFNLLGRKDKLYLHGPLGLDAFVQSMLASTGVSLQFDLKICEHEASASRLICRTKFVEVETIPLRHRIPTTGYLFREQVHPRRILPERIKVFGVPHQALRNLQQGADWTSPEGQLISNDQLTVEGRKAISFAYCTDTAYAPEIVDLVKGVTLLFHEATFTSSYTQEAHARGHSTAAEAARIALQADAETLLIGHFSARNKDITELLNEALDIFRPTLLALEGSVIPIGA